MLKVFGAAVLPLVVGGCALPMSVQIASWAVDGISYIATEKSVGDHVLSAVVDQDCAVWRTLKGDDICIDASDEIQVATAEVVAATATTGDPEARKIAREPETATMASNPDDMAADDAAAFETAAGASFAARLAALPTPTPKPARPADAAPSGGPVIPEASWELGDGTLLYVIASYDSATAAAEGARHYADLDPLVVRRPLDGGRMHRLVVAFTDREQQHVRSRLVRAGVREMWATRITGETWPVMSPPRLDDRAPVQTADADPFAAFLASK